MDLKAIQHEAFVFIGDKDEYAEIIPDGNIDEAAELMAEFVHHLWECGMEYTPDTGEGQSNIPDVSVSLLERAASLVGNPGTNISGSTDMACEQWQKDYERWRNER